MLRPRLRHQNLILLNLARVLMHLLLMQLNQILIRLQPFIALDHKCRCEVLAVVVKDREQGDVFEVFVQLTTLVRFEIKTERSLLAMGVFGLENELGLVAGFLC